MTIRIDRKKFDIKAVGGRGAAKSGAAPSVAAAGRGAGDGRVDRFDSLGRLVGGSGPSAIVSAHAPGERVTMPLSEWELQDIKHDKFFRLARERMEAYRNLPDPWKRQVDDWGKRVNKELQYSLASAIMKKRS